MINNRYAQCALCSLKICEPERMKISEETPSLEKTPAFCPMKLMPEVINEALSEYDKAEIKEFARLASIQEFECYEHLPDGPRTKIPRVEELIQFSHKCGYKSLGIAHCGGLANEARLLTKILEAKGFEVVSVECKVGAIPKERIGLRSEETMKESMCNPIAQALILNKSNIDMAVMLGLCIGHDTLFIKYCNVPMTVIAVKDRVFGHNPLAALYLSDTYYRRLKN